MVEFFGTLIVVIIGAFIALMILTAAFVLVILPLVAIVVGTIVAVGSFFQKDQETS